MKYAVLGPSGCVVSRFGLGTSNFGRDCSEQEANRILDYFVDEGGTLIDTADRYQRGEAEATIGRWINAKGTHVRDQVVIATKARFPTSGHPNGAGLSRKHLMAALTDSLRRLGVETVDLYQFHAPDPLTPVDESLAFLDDAISSGKILYGGVSNFPGWQLQRIVAAGERIHRRIVSLQAQYSLMSREAEYEMLPASRANDVAFLVWSPLARGWLSGKYVADARPAPGTRLFDLAEAEQNSYSGRSAQAETWRILAVLKEMAHRLGASPAQLALSWLLDRPGVTSVILGARTVAQLADNLGALNTIVMPEDLDALTQVSDPPRSAYPYGAFGQHLQARALPSEA